jgi:hypothetical protein
MSGRKETRRSPSGGARRPLLHPSPTTPKYDNGSGGYKHVNEEPDVEFQQETSALANTQKVHSEYQTDTHTVSTPSALSQTSAADSLIPPRATPETLSAEECIGNVDHCLHQKLQRQHYRKKTDSLNNGSVQLPTQPDFGTKLSALPSGLHQRYAKSDGAIKETGNRQRSYSSINARRLSGSAPLSTRYDLGSSTDDGLITSDKDDEDEGKLQHVLTGTTAMT